MRDKSKLAEWLDSPNRWTIEIWLWMTLTIIVIVLSILFPHIWAPISIVYLAVVSNYALVLTAAGARQASLARISADENVTPEDIAEHLVEHTTIDRITNDQS